MRRPRAQPARHAHRHRTDRPVHPLRARVAGGDCGDTPRSLVGKFPSDDPRAGRPASCCGNFWKEVSFYRELPAAPRHPHAALLLRADRGRGPEHALLLEDLAPAAQGDQLARLHARGGPRRGARARGAPRAHLVRPLAARARVARRARRGTVQIGRSLYRAQLRASSRAFAIAGRADEVAILARVADVDGPAVRAARRRLRRGARRLPPRQPADRRVALAAADRRRRLAEHHARQPAQPTSPTSWAPGSCRTTAARVEREIVDAYHAASSPAGVAGYDPFERCWTDYRRGVFAGFAVTVIASHDRAADRARRRDVHRDGAAATPATRSICTRVRCSADGATRRSRRSRGSGTRSGRGRGRTDRPAPRSGPRRGYGCRPRGARPPRSHASPPPRPPGR